MWAVNELNCSEGNNVKATKAYQKSLIAGTIFVDYIFLDTDERRRMAQYPHEYLIEQLQFTGEESVGTTSNRIKLNFNHPCKELIWVVQPDTHTDYCSSFECKSQLFNLLGAQPFNYSDALDVLPNAMHVYSSHPGLDEFVHENEFKDSPFTAEQDGTAGDTSSGIFAGDGATNSGVSDAAAFVLGETGMHLHCWGENPTVTAKLQLNGQDRFSDREGTYFDQVQPYQHHTRAPDTGINVYYFAERPEDHQPSGTCNFSRIDNATLNLVLSRATVDGVNTARVRTYATNYNVFRVMSGMGKRKPALKSILPIVFGFYYWNIQLFTQCMLMYTMKDASVQ